MGRFQTRVAYLIELLEADYLKRGQRERVDEMIWDTEKDAENAEMRTPDETPEVRSSEFRAELLDARGTPATRSSQSLTGGGG
jgi:hypothetical protein